MIESLTRHFRAGHRQAPYDCVDAEGLRDKALRDAVVRIEADSLLRRLRQFAVALFTWDSTLLGSYRIVVSDLGGFVLWTNPGYSGETDPFGCFREVCEEIEYFGLETFRKRHGPGYFSAGRWR